MNTAGKSIGPRPGHARTLRGRLLFGPDLTCFAIDRLMAQGATIKTTPLTEEFDFESYRAHYGAAAIPLMLITPDKRLRLFTTDDPPKPEPGDLVVSLIKA